VYQTGWPTVENLVEDADNDFFNRVLYIMKIMFYIRCYPNETTMVRDFELRCRHHERGLFLRPTTPNAILYTNNNCI